MWKLEHGIHYSFNNSLVHSNTLHYYIPLHSDGKRLPTLLYWIMSVHKKPLVCTVFALFQWKWKDGEIHCWYLLWYAIWPNCKHNCPTIGQQPRFIDISDWFQPDFNVTKLAISSMFPEEACHLPFLCYIGLLLNPTLESILAKDQHQTARLQPY